MSQVWNNLNFVLSEICVGSYFCCFSGPAEVAVANFRDEDFSTEAETKRQRRSRSARISHRFVPPARNALAPIDFSSRDHSRTLLEQAFDDSMYQLNWGFSSGAPGRFLNSVVSVLDHFAADPAIIPINATGQQLVTLCRSVCDEEWAQIFDPNVTS